MSKAKVIRPAEMDAITQPWHTLVDTLRLLPSVTASARPAHPDPSQELRFAQREKKTLDEAFEQVNNLIRLRRGDVPLLGSTASEAVVVLPSPVVPSSNGGSPALGSGVKRKRERRGSSISPAPQPAPVKVEGQSLAVPRLEGVKAGGTAGGVAMTPVNSTGAAHLNISAGLGINGGPGRSSASPLPPTRSGTPTSRQITGKERKDVLVDQLPLLKGRRVLFKQPQTTKDRNEDGEEEAWILGTIVECIGGDKNRYRVLDADDQAEVAAYNTTLKSIIPLPDPSLPLNSPAHPSNIDEYPKNTLVLALYPETTSFYPAKVLVPPTRLKEPGKNFYRVFFEGDDVGYREVAPGDVVMRNITYHSPNPLPSRTISITLYPFEFEMNGHPVHPLLHNYPGASFKTHPFDNGNMTGPHLAQASGGDSLGYYGLVPVEMLGPGHPGGWGLPPAILAAQEGRGTGVYGQLVSGQGQPFAYGWPKYGPMPLKPELGGFAGKLNPYGRSYPHGFYKSLQ